MFCRIPILPALISFSQNLIGMFIMYKCYVPSLAIDKVVVVVSV